MTAALHPHQQREHRERRASKMKTSRGMTIAVVGQRDPDPQVEGYAEEVGHGLAAAAVTIVCGGLGGVMEAACRGAKRAHGTTIGLLPGLDRVAGNPYLDVAIPTGLGEGRNLLVVRAADALVAIGGGYGTLSEIALALRAGLPVIGLATWELWRAGARDEGIRVVETPQQAVRAAVEVATRRT
jgi:uncharacterized protein (TIGR00725 family)